MNHKFANWVIKKTGDWLLKNSPPRRTYMSNFQHICSEIKPCDVLLIEGRNRISNIIKDITQSPWTHAVLCIGNIENFKDPILREKIKKYYKKIEIASDLSKQLIIETDIGVGTIVSPLEKYREDHIRILRPDGILPEDIEKVIEYAISHLGTHYSVRHIFDLFRFLFPWSFLPRKWRSTLFQTNALKPTEDICSAMIAEAFQSVNFPILPYGVEENGHLEKLVQLNPKLFTPSDFDFSPYFQVIKYPLYPFNKELTYRDLPWKTDAEISNDKFRALEE